jgi:hypothetical protein
LPHLNSCVTAMARKVPFTRHAGAPRRRGSDFTISFWRRSFSNSTCSANFLFHVVVGGWRRAHLPEMTISLSDLVLTAKKSPIDHTNDLN